MTIKQGLSNRHSAKAACSLGRDQMGVRSPDWNECQPAGSCAEANIPSFLKDNSVTIVPTLPMVSQQEPGLQ